MSGTIVFMDGEVTRIKSTAVLSMTRLAVLFAIVAVLGFIGGLSVGAENKNFLSNVSLLGSGLDPTPDASADLDDFWRVWNAMSVRFVQTHASSTQPSSKEKLWGAIEGMVASYGDPYTVFMKPEEAKTFAEDISGNFGGVGMEIGIKDSILTVIAPLKNTPAERAGVRAGDQVVLIDGVSTKGLSTDEAVRLIRGEKGTVVTIRVFREGEDIEIPITRDIIQVPTIEATYNTQNEIFTISLYSFTANSGSLFTKALTEFRNTGSHKLLIDLRGNPGGYLASAVSIASHFLPSGEIIVTEDYNGHQENIEHRSRGTGGIPEGTRVVILMDKGSASASEIVAGALQDTKKATLIGTHSFGKGSVQELVDVGEASLKITVARWLTPSGRSISDGGLTPDIEVDRTADDVTAGVDPQLDRAVEFLTTGK